MAILFEYLLRHELDEVLRLEPDEVLPLTCNAAA